MLIFSSITPHSPLLIPAIGKENLEKLNQTKAALENLERNLYMLCPDTILIITPHGEKQPKNFGLQFSEKFTGNFQDFGDLATKLEFFPDVSFANKIKIRAEGRLPIILNSKSELDHGALVPLFYLAQNLPNIRVVPILPGGLDLAAHFEFGRHLGNEILNSNKRIAVIASGDLSHSLSKNSPAKYSPKGKIFDKKILMHIEKGELSKLKEIESDLTRASNECALPSLIILAGIMENIEYKPKILSYEYPFGVGNMVAEFELK